MLTQIEKRYTKIEVDIVAPAARIRLANGPDNVIDVAMLDELLAALEAMDEREDVSFVMLAGNQRVFSAGLDVGARRPTQARDTLTKFHSVIRALAGTRKITIAAVRGACMGAGAELALVCDMIYCTEDSIWQFPEINLAAFPTVATLALSQAVGRKRAAELIFTGQVIHGDEAFPMGLANDAVPDEELEDLVDEVGQRLASLSPAALALAKKAFCKHDARQLGEALQQAEAIYLEEVLKTDDALEGVNAFLEKRRPVWKGR